jgi:hypothetical protein
MTPPGRLFTDPSPWTQDQRAYAQRVSFCNICLSGYQFATWEVFSVKSITLGSDEGTSVLQDVVIVRTSSKHPQPSTANSSNITVPSSATQSVAGRTSSQISATHINIRHYGSYTGGQQSHREHRPRPKERLNVLDKSQHRPHHRLRPRIPRSSPSSPALLPPPKKPEKEAQQPQVRQGRPPRKRRQDTHVQSEPCKQRNTIRRLGSRRAQQAVQHRHHTPHPLTSHTGGGSQRPDWGFYGKCRYRREFC